MTTTAARVHFIVSSDDGECVPRLLAATRYVHARNRLGPAGADQPCGPGVAVAAGHSTRRTRFTSGPGAPHARAASSVAPRTTTIHTRASLAAAATGLRASRPAAAQRRRVVLASVASVASARRAPAATDERQA